MRETETNTDERQVTPTLPGNLSESDATCPQKQARRSYGKWNIQFCQWANRICRFVDLPIRLKRQTNIWYPNHTSSLYASAQEGAFMKEKRTVALTLHIDTADSGDSP